MRLDVTMIKGDPKKPSVFFVHGIGMDKRIWESPKDSKILGGRFSVSLLLRGEPGQRNEGVAQDYRRKRLSLGRPPGNLATLFHDLSERGFTVIAWSQRRPAAEIEIALSELREVITLLEEHCRSGIILIGHSRGGLVARKYLIYGDKRVRGIVTLATPHKGSRMAQWAVYLSPLSSLLAPFLSEAEKGTVTHTVKNIADFLSSKAVRELLPDSPLFKSFPDQRADSVYCLSAGGSDPTLFSVYRAAIEETGEKGKKKRITGYQKIFSVPEVFEKLIPGKLFPDEMKKGRGDGLVSVESSRHPWADEHHLFPVNHAAILFEKRVRDKIVSALEPILG